MSYENPESRIEDYFRIKSAGSSNYRGATFFASGKKALSVKQGKVLNLDHLYFDIVSDLELRISDFASLGIFTLVKNPLQITPFYAKQTQFPKGQNERKYLLYKVI